MDELDLQGKKYISSKRAAEITGYAKDYVGQLARGGKVPATRVGRAWYVERDSIKRHAGVEDASEVRSDALEASSAVHRSSESLVSLSSIQSRGAQGTRERMFNTWGSVTYLPDERELLPVVKLKDSEQVSVPIRVDKKKILQSMNMSPVREASQNQLDGVRLPTRSSIPVRREVEIKKKASLPIYVGATAVVACAVLVIALGGFYAPREWLLGFESSQTASSADFSVLLDYFSLLFTQGVDLIAEFLSLLVGSLRLFFEAGLSFFLSFF